MRLLINFLLLVSAIGIFEARAEEETIAKFVGHFAYPSPKKLEVDPVLLGQRLAEATIDSGAPYYFSKNEGVDFNFKNFMVYLEARADRKMEYSAGTEDKLKVWVLSQPDNSIDPVKIYTESLRLNGRNIFTSILAIHQLLRNNARWFDKKRYVYESSRKEAETFFNKFIDIRGDLRERGAGFSGDHAGSWYRMWGMMLYRAAWEDDTLFNEKATCDSGVGETVKGCIKWMAPKIVARGAEFCKVNRPDEIDKIGKQAINQIGGSTMSSLLWHLQTPEKIKNSRAETNRNYLKIIE